MAARCPLGRSPRARRGDAGHRPRHTLAEVSGIGNIQFEEVAAGKGMWHFQAGTDADATMPVGASWGQEPDGSDQQSILINTATDAAATLDPDSALARWVVHHEVEHALGFEHPFEAADGFVLRADLDTTSTTLMSYNWNGVDGARFPEMDHVAISAQYGPSTAAAPAVDVDRTLYGGAGADALYGGSGFDRLIGGGGDDLLVANGGNDTVWGGAGNDAIYGGAGSDILVGEDGDDRLYGGSGSDVIYSGTGNDTLVGGAGADWFMIDGGEGIDTIADFRPAEGDRISLHGGVVQGVYDTAQGAMLHLAAGNGILLEGWRAADYTPGWIFAS